MATKHLIIIAGANGSGKTTFAVPYVEELGYVAMGSSEKYRIENEVLFNNFFETL